MVNIDAICNLNCSPEEKKKKKKGKSMAINQILYQKP